MSKIRTIIHSARCLGLAFFLLSCARESTPVEPDSLVRPLSEVGEVGSLAPFLARGYDGTLVMSWIEPREDGHMLQFATLQDQVWSAPRTVASGDNWFVNWADFPAVVPISENLWGAHWLVRQPAGGYAYDVHLATSHDNGDTWSDSVLAHRDNTETEHGFVSFYPLDSGFGFVYLDGRKAANEFTENPNDTGMTLRAATLSSEGELANEEIVDSLICDCCQTDVAMTSDGAIAVYRNRTEAEIRDIHVTRRIDGQWTEGKAIHDDGWEIHGCPVNGPEIAASGSDVAVAWFTAANDMPRVQFARSSDSGKTFTDPVNIASGELLGHIGMTLDKQGDAWVIWQQSAGEGQAELNLRRVFADNDLDQVHTIVAKGAVAAFSVSQIMAHEDHLILAWTEGGYGDTRIVSAAIELPTGN